MPTVLNRIAVLAAAPSTVGCGSHPVSFSGPAVVTAARLVISLGLDLDLDLDLDFDTAFLSMSSSAARQ
ncbi:hypothetical protein QBC33DRAFT_559752 [Phialemonium atrogriseum]|uniref:Uncharacterized protein n=1 Tax=Phialemonium atrogriseum TaxID=1093897 RepID=A0AAJ0BXR1_9PEZI|nr:uncharacterized protein QBC33DRAFT_559752 [Phialemonium atrogriseum]KAK1766430.1 hypothetical protein QBC33DRAFT_559752 [Phialemonium atrogriseum]